MMVTEAQTEALKRMPHYHVVAHLETGALVVIFDKAESLWMVVDSEGRIYAFSRYLEKIQSH